ncbi:hypothetical protein [Sphingobium chungbukense]|uniref:Uncharacterized protein n=1 Tax=Sphingobium chungbukense TaxID=56193 RepID=A0A0M3AV97_9SPHN|nr:hypothetical protein [Sphingobium chungbukense]KKW92499.1 hypothetical protein YP76_05945 [Sphingobium chungbukense]
MLFRITVTQTLRVEKSTVIEVEAISFDEAVEAISTGEIDLPSASDDIGKRWWVDRSSLEDEAYYQHGSGGQSPYDRPRCSLTDIEEDCCPCGRHP